MSTFREDVARVALADGQVAGIVRKYTRDYLAALLTARGVAARLGVAVPTIFAWRRAGRLVGVRGVGRWAFDPGEVARTERDRVLREKCAR